jgi:chemotaxis protein CheD
MPESDGALPEIHVQPGESHLVRETMILRTVLGSCVGITFWAPRKGLAALCHPMLPHCPTRTAVRIKPASGRRYVDFAVCDLARQFDSLAVNRAEVVVKLFGGGDVLIIPSGSSRPTVGSLNCEAALNVLRDEGFNIAASSLGGTSGLHIKFHTGTGEVLLRRLN